MFYIYFTMRYACQTIESRTEKAANILHNTQTPRIRMNSNMESKKYLCDILSVLSMQKKLFILIVIRLAKSWRNWKSSSPNANPFSISSIFISNSPQKGKNEIEMAGQSSTKTDNHFKVTENSVIVGYFRLTYRIETSPCAMCTRFKLNIR